MQGIALYITRNTFLRRHCNWQCCQGISLLSWVTVMQKEGLKVGLDMLICLGFDVITILSLGHWPTPLGFDVISISFKVLFF